MHSEKKVISKIKKTKADYYRYVRYRLMLRDAKYRNKMGHNHKHTKLSYKNLPEFDELPDGAELFEWREPKDRDRSVGKFIQVETLDGRHVFVEIVKQSGWYIKTKYGMFCFKEREHYLEKEDKHQGGRDWAERMRKKYDEMALVYIKTGDIYQALLYGFPNHNFNGLKFRYYVLINSKTFMESLQKQLKKALADNDIDASYVVKLRKELIETAKEQKDVKGLNEAIKGLEAMLMKASEAEKQLPIGQNGQNPAIEEGRFDPKRLLEKKMQMQQSAQDIQDAEIIEEE